VIEKRQNDILEFIKDIGNIKELTTLLSKTVNATVKLTNAQNALFWMVKKGNLVLAAQTFKGKPYKEGGTLGYKVSMSKSILGDAYLSGEPFIEENVKANILYDDLVDKRNNFETKNMLAVPIIASNGKTLGILQILNSHEEVFGNREQNTMEMVSLYLANILESLILKQQLEKVNVGLEEELQKRVEELSQVNSGLEQRIKEEVNKSIELAKKAMLGEMIAAIVHQWKQPINVIRMNTSSAMMLRELGTLSDDELKTSFDMIDTQLDYMVKTMNDFKDFLKPATLKLFKIDESIKSIIFMLGKIYESKGITVSVVGDEKLEIFAYQAEFEQVLINILNNARDIIVEKDVDKKDIVVDFFKSDDDKSVIITIADFAGGIPEDILPKIFDSYFTTKGKGGTGIGLDICKEILKKTDGTIWATNENHEIFGTDETIPGAQFHIQIPILSEAQMEAKNKEIEDKIKKDEEEKEASH
jgi:signal transduction histidine kinase